ncbi:hypothetical protein ACJX0J_010663, partial [Zea mays]
STTHCATQIMHNSLEPSQHNGIAVAVDLRDHQEIFNKNIWRWYLIVVYAVDMVLDVFDEEEEEVSYSLFADGWLSGQSIVGLCLIDFFKHFYVVGQCYWKLNTTFIN